jgi:hypothetical protein
LLSHYRLSWPSRRWRGWNKRERLDNVSECTQCVEAAQDVSSSGFLCRQNVWRKVLEPTWMWRQTRWQLGKFLEIASWKIQTRVPRQAAQRLKIINGPWAVPI